MRATVGSVAISGHLTRLLRRFAPRNDDSATQQRPNSLKQ
ncbi:hypothetical protein RFEPED_1190 [Rickettsia felis str. Pedreira]|uniref:Uncharacterized protein n=1 Tax=Rickettsia felis str. Pedreira TaxID=1359196 RepID=A0A0F3MTM5_RICFI|nr:hypothetical protein RFEPED_1190 [Rickettsia felis str. Pedreira]